MTGVLGGRVAVVIGGTSGTGQALAHGLVEADAGDLASGVNLWPS